MNQEKWKVWINIFWNLAIHFPFLFQYKKSVFLSDRQTLMRLMETQQGMVRFGDGELGYLSGYSYIHQRQEPSLRKKLKKILRAYSRNSSYLIGIPAEILFGEFQKRNLPKKGWRAGRYSLYPYVRINQCYGSAFCFRILAVVDDDRKSYARLLLQLFGNKEIVYVGGIEPYPGLIEVKKFIKIPPKNAFEEYEDILKAIEKEHKKLSNPLVLISAGITATALAAELNDIGITAYDVGLCFTKRLAAILKENERLSCD